MHNERRGGDEIRLHCAGGKETIREDWLREVRLENGSFIHLSYSFFLYLLTTIFKFFTSVSGFMSKTRWAWMPTLEIDHRKSWRVWDTWHEEYIHVICRFWIRDYKMLYWFEWTVPKLLLLLKFHLMWHHSLMFLLHKIYHSLSEFQTCALQQYL